MSRRSARLLVLFAAVTACSSGCSSPPLQGPVRERPPLRVSEQAMFTLGEAIQQDLRGRYPVVTTGEPLALLRRVARRIAAATYQDHYPWQLVLLDDPRASAVCLPGGKLVVFTGLLAQLKSPDDAAALLGHIAAHATLRHSDERLSEPGARPALPAPITAKTWDGLSPASKDALLETFTLGPHPRPYAPALEVEADEVGLAYLQRAGFDPEVAARFWSRIAKADPQQRTLLPAHPGAAARATNLARRARELLGKPAAASERDPRK